MNDYLLLMHSDVPGPIGAEEWNRYFAGLRQAGAFDGGSAIAGGEIMRKDGAERPITAQLAGYIRVRAEDMAAARALVIGNPVFENGGSVEIRELPRD